MLARLRIDDDDDDGIWAPRGISHGILDGILDVIRKLAGDSSHTKQTRLPTSTFFCPLVLFPVGIHQLSLLFTVINPFLF